MSRWGLLNGNPWHQQENTEIVTPSNLPISSHTTGWATAGIPKRIALENPHHKNVKKEWHYSPLHVFIVSFCLCLSFSLFLYPHSFFSFLLPWIFWAESHAIQKLPAFTRSFNHHLPTTCYCSCCISGCVFLHSCRTQIHYRLMLYLWQARPPNS